MKPGLLRALDGVSLLKPTYRVYEALRSARPSREHTKSDGLPVPPVRLRTTVAGTPGLAWFLESGRQQAAIIRDASARHGRSLQDVGRLLDFGCGCGRVLRHWSGLTGPEVHGTDFNRRLVRWCHSNLPFASCAVNRLQPPLPYDAGSFDLVYAVSVFTHLPQDLESAWIDDL